MHIPSYKTIHAGFTLLETLLVVALMSVMTTVAVPISLSFLAKNSLDIATNTLAQDLHRAQLLAQAADSDQNWGVTIQGNKVIVFKGVSYLLRQSQFDEVSDFPASLTASGLTEIVFNKLTGWPQATGTLTIQTTTNETRTLTINSKGMVAY